MCLDEEVSFFMTWRVWVWMGLVSSCFCLASDSQLATKDDSLVETQLAREALPGLPGQKELTGGVFFFVCVCAFEGL